MFYAGLAHLVERDLAKVEVVGSSPISRSNLEVWQSLVDCNGLENRRTLIAFREFESHRFHQYPGNSVD